jgi:hypothetical protein
MGPTALLPYLPSSSVGFEAENLGSNGKYDNHYTTENDKISQELLAFVSHTMRGISWAGQKIPASKDGLRTMEICAWLVNFPRIKFNYIYEKPWKYLAITTSETWKN